MYYREYQSTFNPVPLLLILGSRNLVIITSIMKSTRILFFLVLLMLLLSACGSAPSSPTATMPSTATAVPSAAETATPAPTSTATETVTPTPLPTQTFTPLPTSTATPTPVPTYLKLRGEVTIDQAVCHYGPGAPYLYKYGVYKGSHLEIIRREERSNYVEIQAIGGNNPCWVRVDYFDIEGDVMNVQPVSAEDVKLPITPYYASPGGVSARRDGNEVTISWNPLILRAGDDSEQTPYIIEAWVCQQGKYIFIPKGSYQTSVKIVDEPGCDLPSKGYFIAAEKHGYTPRVAVPWPAP